MIIAPTNAVSAEVSPVDVHARGALLLLLASSLGWLVLSGILALIAAIQLHSPAFLQDLPWLTHGRAEALRETAFIYGWAANAGLGIGLWLVGRLGGNLLRALNWTVTGTVFWNLGVLAGLVGIALGDMTSLPMLQLPRYVQPLLVVAYAAIALSGVLAWSGRRVDSTYASQWYVVAALFLFPWLLTAGQMVMLWAPMRGTLQAIAAAWYAQGIWSFWLAPLALAGAYYIVPKVTGRLLPSYEFAPLAFWVLLMAGGWTAGRALVGGPVPAWISTVAIVAGMLVLFHHMVLGLNLRVVLGGTGNALSFIRFGLAAYILSGVLNAIVSFRVVAERLHFTFAGSALDQLAYQGAISTLFFGSIYYMLPRLTGRTWSSGALIVGHRVLFIAGVVGAVVSLTVAGWLQGGYLLDGKTPVADILGNIRGPLLIATASQLVMLAANLLLVVNFFQSVCPCRTADASSPGPFRQPSAVEATAT
ncbi:MAG: cbb3-type cytochrome c oxidase subunit I [Opitutaceae bacterium]|nr:cbb3-type cytochrome c oxidase subunit I [Opitutaceae bacterium]